MDEVPICRSSLIGRVLTHGRDHDAIAQLERAESVRSEQRAHCCPRSIVKPIGAAEIALRPFENWLVIANDQGLNPSDFHQTAMDVFAMRQQTSPFGRAALPPKVG